ncbi:MAG TPA: glucose-6-phosphate isomerase, partial [Armatimonadota bacterium]|nr:glucose-6-phosphate isomerase [Armatimonadota bacterium]
MNGQVPLSLDYSYLLPEVTPEEIASWQPQVTLAHNMLHEKSGLGNDFLGWMNPQDIMPAEQLAEIKKAAARLREQADVMVVVGIGGSYLGARTVIEALGDPNGPQVWFAGQTLSAEYTAQLLAALENKNFCINVVSKSGTTTEPAIAFRLLRDLLVRKVGKDKAKDLIVATTDPKSGALRKMSDKEGYQTFPIPGNVGGRYSVFTAVGMLPIAFAGVDVDALIGGAMNCAKACSDADLSKNPAYVYAVVRNLLYRKGKGIEMLASFEPRMHYLAEWWKQLYGESEGKNLMGIFPASVEFTTDLHSMGQWIQEGRRDIFETFVDIAGGLPKVTIPSDPDNNDGLNFLAGMPVAEVNHRAFQGTALAHRDGGVPSMTITLDDLSANTIGALLYFFEKACGISGYLLGVNPFNQPGVESYKKNMFALLNKPGYEDKAVTVTAAVKENIGKHVVKF